MSLNRKGLWKLIIVPVVAVPMLALSCGPGPAPKPTQPATTAPTPTQRATTAPTTPAPTAAPGTRPAGDPAAGERTFNSQGCSGCHVAKGAGGQVGPKLDGLFGSKVTLTNGQEATADESYIRESIVNPNAKVKAGFQPIMPPSFASLPAQDLQNLIAFIASLK
ncbi:MAG: cytochrome c [Chloroflexi bacterium]|nr:cytochrome c [Chloroflexota bacterium]